MSYQKKTATLHHSGREKASPAKNKGAKKAAQGVPLIVFYWSVGLGFLSYLVSRFVFTPHPLHWASAAGGLLLGILIGYIWYLTRGDVGLI